MQRGNRIVARTLALVCAALLVPSLGHAAKKAPLATKGDILYTQFSLFYEKGHHITTNYRVGTLVPINTRVEFVKATRKKIVVKIPDYDNAEVEFVNVKDYSGEDIEGIFKRTFATTKVDFQNFAKEAQSAIQRGEVEIGMSKDAVVLAMGYPPKHKTPTLKLNQWRYWKSRFNTVLVEFEDDHVTKITD